jgi:hypothetical protein
MWVNGYPLTVLGLKLRKIRVYLVVVTLEVYIFVNNIDLGFRAFCLKKNGSLCEKSMGLIVRHVICESTLYLH